MDISILGFLRDSYTRIVTEYYPAGDCEIWLNRAEWRALGEPTELLGHTAYPTIAIKAGFVALFDRKRLTYLRDPAGG